jgi:hypothetical protein
MFIPDPYFSIPDHGSTIINWQRIEIFLSQKLLPSSRKYDGNKTFIQDRIFFIQVKKSNGFRIRIRNNGTDEYRPEIRLLSRIGFFHSGTPGVKKSNGSRIRNKWNRRIQTWRLCGRDSWRGWDRCPHRRSRACPWRWRGRARRACWSRGAATSPTSAARPAS